MILLQLKWNKDKEDVWRLELPGDIEDKYDEGSKDKINKSDYQVDASG